MATSSLIGCSCSRRDVFLAVNFSLVSLSFLTIASRNKFSPIDKNAPVSDSDNFKDTFVEGPFPHVVLNS